jgi:hypothetical protein
VPQAALLRITVVSLDGRTSPFVHRAVHAFARARVSPILPITVLASRGQVDRTLLHDEESTHDRGIVRINWSAFAVSVTGFVQIHRTSGAKRRGGRILRQLRAKPDTFPRCGIETPHDALRENAVHGRVPLK